MKTYCHQYVDIGELCDFMQLNRQEVMDAISNSNVSFGTNFDTLVTQDQLQIILDENDFNTVLDFLKLDKSVVISLGS